MKEIKSVNLEKGKHFTPRFKEPYLVIKILGKKCAICIVLKAKKKFYATSII
jgi:hypothetical protein